MYVWYFFAALLLFSGWNSVLKDPRKHSKREFAISCSEARIKRTSPRLSYSPTSTLRSICFTLSSSKFHATFSPRIFALPCFSLFRFWLVHGTNKPWVSWHVPSALLVRDPLEQRKTREKKILASLPASFSNFVLSTFHPPTVASAFLSARLFQNTSQVWLCSCGLYPFILLNYCTVVHYKRGNKSKEGKIGFEPNSVVTLR